MRSPQIFAFLFLFAASVAGAAEGRVCKVLPQFLDEQGRASTSPSLYDRDAFQAYLVRHPSRISGLRFAVQWKAKAPKTDQLKLRVEMRGVVHGDAPKLTSLEEPIPQRYRHSHWSYLNLSGADYKAFGEVTAWRVTLWDGGELLGEQKSFLW